MDISDGAAYYNGAYATEMVCYLPT